MPHEAKTVAIKDNTAELKTATPAAQQSSQLYSRPARDSTADFRRANDEIEHGSMLEEGKPRMTGKTSELASVARRTTKELTTSSGRLRDIRELVDKICRDSLQAQKSRCRSLPVMAHSFIPRERMRKDKEDLTLVATERHIHDPQTEELHRDLLAGFTEKSYLWT